MVEIPGMITRQALGTIAPYLIATLIAGGALGAFVHYERQKGREEILQQQYDIRHKADSLRADSSAQAASVLRQAFKDQADKYDHEKSRRELVVVQTGAVLATLKTVRDSALALAHTSTATVMQLDAQLERLVVASDSAEHAHKLREEAWQKATDAAELSLLAGKQALAAQTAATNDAITRALSAEGALKAFHATRPGIVSNILWGGGLVAAGIGLDRLISAIH